jgi:hypothetical protein
MFGPSVWSIDLLCPLLTSANPSRHLSITVVRDRLTDLPGYCALTFTLISAASTFKLSVQVLDFEDNGLLIQLARLLCGFCSSDQRFACGFLQIPPRDGHPCRPANYSPCRASGRLSLPSEFALRGAPIEKDPTVFWQPGQGCLRLVDVRFFGFLDTDARARWATDRTKQLAPRSSSEARSVSLLWKSRSKIISKS